MVKHRCIVIHHPAFDESVEEAKRTAEVFVTALKATLAQSEVTGGMTQSQKEEMQAYLNQFRFLIRKVPKETL